jgi:hypothetical protein
MARPLNVPLPSSMLPIVLLQQDTSGLGVILLTSLTEEQWVEEDDMARKLNLPNKMVRKALRYLEQVRHCAGQMSCLTGGLFIDKPGVSAGLHGTVYACSHRLAAI